MHKEILVHIDTIRIGDTIKHDDLLRTINKNNLHPGGLMGTTLFGDSYNLGTKQVSKIVFPQP